MGEKGRRIQKGYAGKDPKGGGIAFVGVRRVPPKKIKLPLIRAKKLILLQGNEKEQ
jgi:hypothetical protein